MLQEDTRNSLLARHLTFKTSTCFRGASLNHIFYVGLLFEHGECSPWPLGALPAMGWLRGITAMHGLPVAMVGFAHVHEEYSHWPWGVLGGLPPHGHGVRPWGGVLPMAMGSTSPVPWGVLPMAMGCFSHGHGEYSPRYTTLSQIAEDTYEISAVESLTNRFLIMIIHYIV